MQKKSLLSWIFLFAKNKKKYYIASIFFALLRVACGIAPYIIIANIVRELLSGVRDWDVYLKECLIIAAFWLGNVLFHSISTTLSHVATFNVLGNIRKDLCDKLSRVPLGSVLDMPSGALKNILVERIDSMETTLAHVVPEFTSNLILPVLMFLYLFHIDWRMGLASLGTLPIGMVAMAVMFAGAQKWFDNSIQKMKALNDTAVEYINGIEVIKAFGKSKSSYDKFVVAAKEGSDCFVEWMRRCIWPHSLAITAVDFITVIIVSVSIMMPLLTIMSYSDDISKAGVIFGEVGSVLEMKELARPATDKRKPADNSITLKDVRFSYHKGIEGEEKKEILHGINMVLPEGSFTAFVGPSGSGKSTIARLIASLWDVDSGDIEIGGVNIRNLSLEEYNRRIAYVSQDNFLFDMSVRENIRLGRPPLRWRAPAHRHRPRDDEKRPHRHSGRSDRLYRPRKRSHHPEIRGKTRARQDSHRHRTPPFDRQGRRQAQRHQGRQHRQQRHAPGTARKGRSLQVHVAGPHQCQGFRGGCINVRYSHQVLQFLQCRKPP